MHRLRRLTLVVGLVVLASAIPAARATNFGAYYADNSGHYWVRVSTNAWTDTATNWGRDRLDATDINMHWDGSCKSQTDICVYDGTYTGSWWATHYGLAQCVKAASSTKCDKWEVYFDDADLSTYNQDFLRRGGCHEFGHTVGLWHREAEASCMREAIGNASQTYSTHDVNHVNGRY